jgi:hypothetical protein
MTIFKTTTLATLVAALMATSGMAHAQTAAPQSDAVPVQAETDATPGAMSGAAAERGGMRARMSARTMERLDTDGSGDISAEEFAARGIGRIVEADADGDGILTIEEIVDYMEQRRAERREARLLRRFDIDGDGTITVEELERHQEKRFAADEMPRRQGMRGHGGPRGQRGGGMGWHGGR